MAVRFHSSASEISVDIGEYQEITEPKSTSKPKYKHLNPVMLSFGILCILQATLNISLRLTLSDFKSEKPELTAGESFTTRAPPPLNSTTMGMSRLCPPGWRRYGSKCYFVSRQTADFEQSRKNCVKSGAQLVKLNNKREQAFLIGFTAAAWIGMTDKDREGIWLWLDRTRVNKNELWWAPGQPDDSNGGEDCGDIRNQDNFIGLNDSNCSVLMQWICEKPLNGM